MNATDIITIRIPGRVYEDYLAPKTTTMESELGLRGGARVRYGRGYAWYYLTTFEIALEVAEYLTDRALTLRGQDDDYQIHTAALQAAARIRRRVSELRAERPQPLDTPARGEV